MICIIFTEKRNETGGDTLANNNNVCDTCVTTATAHTRETVWTYAHKTSNYRMCTHGTYLLACGSLRSCLTMRDVSTSVIAMYM